jgi:hypothetical protein
MTVEDIELSAKEAAVPLQSLHQADTLFALQLMA